MERRTALITACLAMLVASAAHAARPVQMDWVAPEPASTLRLPVEVTVVDPRPDWLWETVGAGIQPGYDETAQPWRVPPRESWFLEFPDRFHRGLLRATVAQLRAAGVWADPGRSAEAPVELQVGLSQFRCRDPLSRSQRCVATATLRLGMALLPDVSVVVGADAREPWNALAEELTAAIAARVAEVAATMPDAQVYEPPLPSVEQPEGPAPGIDLQLATPVSLDEYLDPSFDYVETPADLPHRSVGRGVDDVRIEVKRGRSSTIIRVLLAVHRDAPERAVLHFNPPGASWVRERFELIDPGVLQAVIQVPSRGRVHLFVVGDTGDGDMRRLLGARENHEIDL